MFSKRKTTWIGAIIVAAGMGIPAFGRTLLVPIQFPTIQSAIDAATDGDQVIVASGTYAGAGNVDVDFRGKAITVTGTGGADACIIDCSASPQNPHRGFVFRSGEGNDSVLEGFTIRNGATELGAVEDRFNGGGILTTNGSSPIIRNVTFENCRAGCWGGAICSSSFSNPIILSCRFVGNYSADDGGAIFAWNSSSPTIINALIVGNSAEVTGGGVTFFDAGGTIVNSTIVGNSARFGAGVLDSSWNTHIENSIIRGNVGDQQIWGRGNVRYSNVEGGFEGEGNIDADPLFLNSERGNYRLRSGSPSVDAGDNNVVPDWVDVDFAFNSRFVDNSATPDTGLGNAPIVDMGAFEHQDGKDCTGRERIASAKCRGDRLTVKLAGGVSEDAFAIIVSTGHAEYGTLNRKGKAKTTFSPVLGTSGDVTAHWGCHATDKTSFECR